MGYNKRYIPVVVLIIYLLALTGAILFKLKPTWQELPAKVDLTDKSIVKEAYDGRVHLIAYVEKGNYNIYNETTGRVKSTFSNLAKPIPCMDLDKDLENTSIKSVKELKCVAPNTYTATIKQSTALLNSYVMKGYIISAYYKDNSSMNYYLYNGDKNIRIIITKELVVLFDSKYYKSVSSEAYINEKGIGT